MGVSRTGRIARISLNILLLSISGVAYQNCSDVRLTKRTDPSVILQSASQLCVAPPTSQTRYNKVMFVVDDSGSNQNTDPNDTSRADNIQTFLNQNASNPYYKWGFIVFGVNLNDSQAYVNYGGDVSQPRFGTAADEQAAITQQRAHPIDGCTPYIGALTLAANGITRDIADHPDEDSVYNVIFITDGFPNDAPGATTPTGGCASDQTVQNSATDPYIMAVKKLVATAPGKVFLSTGYYTPTQYDPNRAAAAGLGYMAAAGGGKFVDFGANGKVDFSGLRVGTVGETWMIKRFVVYNMNSAFCEDGSVDTDSDSDGICDKDEVIFNNTFAGSLPAGVKFDPVNRNSIDPNYSDLFAFKFQVLPGSSGLNSCTNLAGDLDHDILNSCEEAMLTDPQANGPTQQWTARMNQGNTSGGAADPTNPDSDGDGFLDSLEFFTFGTKSAAVNYLNMQDSYAGGITGEQIMTQHRNYRNPSNYGADQYNISMVQTGVNSLGQNCYKYSQSQLALYPTQAVTVDHVSNLTDLVHGAGENVVLVYYIVVPESDPNSPGYLVYSYQKFHYKDASFSPGINLDPSIFSQYKVPITSTP